MRLLTLRHPGLSLYPVDGQQLAAWEGGVVVGAALLPCDEDTSEGK